jgi:hypothetical protein
MSNRSDFTRQIAKLFVEMWIAKVEVVLDFAKRSDEEQFRLYKIGRTQDPSGNWIITGNKVTNCDGLIKRSAHQDALAVDAYIIVAGKIAPDDDPLWAKWHQRWVELGGKPMLEWDKGHWEWKE